MTSRIDPVQGLVDYVLDIKPYHTKIIETLIEYVHTDEINVTIGDVISSFQVDIVRPFPATDLDDVDPCENGYDTGPYDEEFSNGYKILEYDIVNNTFTIAGDHTGEFAAGAQISFSVKKIDGITDAVIPIVTGSPPTLTLAAQEHSSTFTIASSTVIPYSVITNTGPFTVVTLAADIVYPAPVGSPPIFYQFNVTHTSIPIIDEIWYSYNSIFEPNENAVLDVGSNMFVIAGNHTPRFVQGYVFEVSGGTNDGIYTTLYSDFVNNTTRIRVFETIRNIAGGSPLGSPATEGGIIKHKEYGYDEEMKICSGYPEAVIHVSFRELLQLDSAALTFDFGGSPFLGIGNTSASFTETFEFSWAMGGASFQYQILSVDPTDNSIEVSGDVTDILSIGDTIQLINSSSNNGLYKIPPVGGSPTESGIFFNGTNTIITLDAMFGSPLQGLVNAVPYGFIQPPYYEFLYDIIAVNDVNETITVAGNVLNDIQIGTTFNIINSATNNGYFKVRWDNTVIGSPGAPIHGIYFDGTNTVIAVTSNLGSPGLQNVTPYGSIIDNEMPGIQISLSDTINVTVDDTMQVLGSPGLFTGISLDFEDVGSPLDFEFGGSPILIDEFVLGATIEDTSLVIEVTLTFEDFIGVSTTENAEAQVVETSGSLIGSWDFTYWDIGSFDESLGVVLHLYSS